MPSLLQRLFPHFESQEPIQKSNLGFLFLVSQQSGDKKIKPKILSHPLLRQEHSKTKDSYYLPQEFQSPIPRSRERFLLERPCGDFLCNEPQLRQSNRLELCR